MLSIYKCLAFYGKNQIEWNKIISFELTLREFASMSEDLRHDGGGDDGGRVHVREVGVHVLGQHEQPNMAGPFRQPEQLGRPQHHCSTLQTQTPSWKGRDLQKSSSKVFMVFGICQNWTRLVLCCRYLSKSVKMGKIPAGKFDEFLTVCQYCQITNVNIGWGKKFRKITTSYVNSDIWWVFLVWQPESNKAGLFRQPEQLGQSQLHWRQRRHFGKAWKDLQNPRRFCFCKIWKEDLKRKNTWKFWQQLSKVSETKIRESTTWSMKNGEIYLSKEEIPWKRNTEINIQWNLTACKRQNKSRFVFCLSKFVKKQPVLTRKTNISRWVKIMTAMRIWTR